MSGSPRLHWESPAGVISFYSSSLNPDTHLPVLSICPSTPLSSKLPLPPRRPRERAGEKKRASRSRLIDSGHNEKPPTRGAVRWARVSAPPGASERSACLLIKHQAGHPHCQLDVCCSAPPPSLKFTPICSLGSSPRVAKWRPLCSRKAVVRPEPDSRLWRWWRGFTLFETSPSLS